MTVAKFKTSIHETYHKQIEIHMTEQKQIFVTYITDNELLPRIYNEFIQIHQKKTTQQEKFLK